MRPCFLYKKVTKHCDNQDEKLIYPSFFTKTILRKDTVVTSPIYIERKEDHMVSKKSSW